MTSRHKCGSVARCTRAWPPIVALSSPRSTSNDMGIDFHLIANFGALALITLAGPAVIFILFYRRGAL